MSEVERDSDDHRQQLEDWVAPAEQQVTQDIIDRRGDLDNALYTFSERYMLGNIEGGIEEEDALRIWAIVESVRTGGFPSNLRV